jgi:hypothetical protein
MSKETPGIESFEVDSVLSAQLDGLPEPPPSGISDEALRENALDGIYDEGYENE